MSKSINRVTILGNLGKNPEISYTKSGTAVAKFTMATTERYKENSGEWADRTEWHNIVVWQKQAEIVGQYVQKGDKLYVEGRLQTSSWEDKTTGEKKYRTEIIASEIVLLGTKEKANPQSDGNSEDQDMPF